MVYRTVAVKLVASLNQISELTFLQLLECEPCSKTSIARLTAFRVISIAFGCRHVIFIACLCPIKILR